jgi:quinol monooxygenase YgiN
MELFLFARFHALEENEGAVVAEVRGAVTRTRGEPGCLAIDAYQSNRDPRQFWIHSRWVDEAAFEVHAALPQTRSFIERVGRLIDHPKDVTRSYAIT